MATRTSLVPVLLCRTTLTPLLFAFRCSSLPTPRCRAIPVTESTWHRHRAYRSAFRCRPTLRLHQLLRIHIRNHNRLFLPILLQQPATRSHVVSLAAFHHHSHREGRRQAFYRALQTLHNRPRSCRLLLQLPPSLLESGWRQSTSLERLCNRRFGWSICILCLSHTDRRSR